ncbi:hypothetical protein [uncultured Eudoraea sp.]|uniref:hypothetical protein n=1 Tax=uncultured Eudoraea sp. TaxID=1035614 RepID=UPI00262EF273|nr:hypothetical protein [uncultured Eudoraea sp.]
MKPLHKYPLLILSMFLLLFTVNVQAQDDKVDKKANELVRAYQAEVGLTIEQATEFQKAIKHYLIKRKEVKVMDASAQDKTSMLKDVSDMENKAMVAILDAKQMKAYKKLKKELQPM